MHHDSAKTAARMMHLCSLWLFLTTPALKQKTAARICVPNRCLLFDSRISTRTHAESQTGRPPSTVQETRGVNSEPYPLPAHEYHRAGISQIVPGCPDLVVRMGELHDLEPDLNANSERSRFAVDAVSVKQKVLQRIAICPDCPAKPRLVHRN